MHAVRCPRLHAGGASPSAYDRQARDVLHCNEHNSCLQLRHHFGWYTRSRNALFADARTRDIIEHSFAGLAQVQNYHVLALEIEPVALRALLSFLPEHSPSEATRRIKGALAAKVRQETGLHHLWSRGWFVRSVGHCTNDVVRNYVASQFEHHRAAPIEQPELAALAAFHSKHDPARLRKGAHVVFEYNAHFVFATRRRREILDPFIAQELIEYWKRVCETKGWLLWDIEVVWDHAHLFLGLTPSESPSDVALSLMNNATWFLEKRHAAVLRREGVDSVWQPGFYAGTAGSATTAQIKAFLRGAEGEGEAPPA